MNIANQMTLLRIILAFFCMGFTLTNTLNGMIIAFILFILASLTDFFDGYFARKYNMISDFGKLMDPIADKVLIIGVFLTFLQKEIVNSWAVIIIMAREFLITGLRMLALKHNNVIEAKFFGKHKTVSQITAIVLIYIILITEKINPNIMWLIRYKGKIIFWLMAWVVVVTVVSGFMYLWTNRKIIRSL